MHLLKAQFVNKQEKRNLYPFNVPTVQSLKLEFTSPVTIFVGENGSGKSTVIESLAAAIGSIAVGDNPIETDDSLYFARVLAKYIKLSWKIKTKKGFFLRSEDYFNYVKNLSKLRLEMESYLEEVEQQYEDKSAYAKALARQPYLNSLNQLEARYGKDLDAYSHGESYFKFVQSRIVDHGLYLLDEPESALSPMKQLAFISLIKDSVQNNCQFIIATHSPVLMAFPGATILSFDDGQVKEFKYEDLEHVNFMKAFLNNPEMYLRHL